MGDEEGGAERGEADVAPRRRDARGGLETGGG